MGSGLTFLSNGKESQVDLFLIVTPVQEHLTSSGFVLLTHTSVFQSLRLEEL